MAVGDYFLLALALALALANNAALRRFGNRGLNNMGDILAFNGCESLVWLAAALCAMRGLRPMAASTLFWGVAYGLALAGFFISKMQALIRGNVSLTTLVGCSSLIIPTLVGSFAFHEPIGAGQAVGLVLLLGSMAICVAPQRGAEAASAKWKVCVLLFFLFNGLVGLTFKFFSHTPGKDEIAQMLAVSSTVSAVIFFLAAFLLNRRTGQPRPRVPGRALWYVLSCGGFSCAYTWINIHLAGALPSAVFFPVFNGGVIFGSTLLSRFLFKERLSRLQWGGLLLGVLALMLAGRVIFGG